MNPPSKSSQLNSPRLSSTITRAALEVLQSIPKLDELRDSTRLPEIIRRLGVFSEASAERGLSTNKPQLPEHDLKWQMLRLRGAINHELQLAATKSAARDTDASSITIAVKSQLRGTVPDPARKQQSNPTPSVELAQLRKLA
jgi:hypothetical protein